MKYNVLPFVRELTSHTKVKPPGVPDYHLVCLNQADPWNHFQCSFLFWIPMTRAMVGVRALLQLQLRMVSCNYSSVHSRCLHAPHVPFSEKCHSLVTKWALGPCVYLFGGISNPKPTVTKAAGPGKYNYPWWDNHLLPPLELQTRESSPSLLKWGTCKFRIVK